MLNVYAPVFIFSQLNQSPARIHFPHLLLYDHALISTLCVIQTPLFISLLLSLVKSQCRVFILQFSQRKLTITQRGDRKSNPAHSPAPP